MPNITRDVGKIFQHGGGRVMVCEVTEAGVPVTSATFEDLGYIQDFQINDDTPFDDVVDETGNTIKSIPGTRKVVFNATLMQVSKDSMRFFNNATAKLSGRYYAIYTLRSRGDNSEGDSYQEIVAGLCKIKPMVNVSYPAPRMPIEISVLYNDSTVTLANGTTGLWQSGSPAYTTKSTAASLVVPRGQYYDVFETEI